MGVFVPENGGRAEAVPTPLAAKHHLPDVLAVPQTRGGEAREAVFPHQTGSRYSTVCCYRYRCVYAFLFLLLICCRLLLLALATTRIEFEQIIAFTTDRPRQPDADRDLPGELPHNRSVRLPAQDAGEASSATPGEATGAARD